MQNERNEENSYKELSALLSFYIKGSPDPNCGYDA